MAKRSKGKGKAPAAVAAWMAELGARGGRSRSARKIEAARASMARINAQREAVRREGGR